MAGDLPTLGRRDVRNGACVALPEALDEAAHAGRGLDAVVVGEGRRDAHLAHHPAHQGVSEQKRELMLDVRAERRGEGDEQRGTRCPRGERVHRDRHEAMLLGDLARHHAHHVTGRAHDLVAGGGQTPDERRAVGRQGVLGERIELEQHARDVPSLHDQLLERLFDLSNGDDLVSR